MKSKIVIGNLKSYMTLADIKNYIRLIDKKINSNNVIICPSNIYVPYFIEKNIKIGLQNIADLTNCTGEITFEQASSCNIKYCLLGHSERRFNFNENDIIINKKIKKALFNNLNVILCIGETEEEKNRFKTNSVLKRQIVNCLREIKSSSNIIIAYEPVWAIGTNKMPTNREISDIVSYIKMVVKSICGLDIKVLYGGSVNENNIKTLNTIEVLDGFLIGKVSTDANKFLQILEVVGNQ